MIEVFNILNLHVNGSFMSIFLITKLPTRYLRIRVPCLSINIFYCNKSIHFIALMNGFTIYHSIMAS